MKTIIKDEILESDNIALKDDRGNQITFRELADNARKSVGRLEKRSLVFILCDHQMETAAFIYEILYMNLVPLLLADDMDGELLEHLITVYRPQYIYCKNFYRFRERYIHKVEMECHTLLATGEETQEIHPDVALLLSTSGTTGSAKLVKLSYDNLYDNAEGACFHLGIQEGQKGISPLPLNHTYGFSFCLWHWHCGATVLMTEESVISKNFNEFYVREKANHFAATPYTFYMLQKLRFWDCNKLGNLHWAMSGGAQLPEKDQKSLVESLKDKFWIGYGQTECTCIISAANFSEGNMRLGTVGKPFHNMNAEIDSETGELVIESKSVCMGYANNRTQLTESDRNRGRFPTGDVAYMDSDGFLYLKGRLTRHIKILGKRVSLDDVENYLRGKLPDTEFACVGTDNSLQVFYVGEDMDLQKQISILLDQSMKIPKKFVSCLKLEEIPRNSSGKVAYGKLKERFS